MTKRSVPRRGRGSKPAHKVGSKKAPPPSRKRPSKAERERRNAVARERYAEQKRERERLERAALRQERARERQRKARERERREAAELRRLIREQERAAREAERQVARDEREAEREAERELDRLIRSQEAARREAEAEDARQRRLEEWFDRQGTLDRNREGRARRKAEKAERERQIKGWQKIVDEERSERGMSRKQRAAERKLEEAIRREAEAAKTVEDYIEESLQAVYKCMVGLGYKTDEPIYYRLQDRAFDAEIRMHDPDDTTGAAALLELQKCIQPIVGAWILLGFRHYPSDQIERRIEMAEAGGKRLPSSLAQRELGMITNLTNYRPAGQSEIAAHVDATEKWLRDFARVNRAYCAQIFVRYYYSPDGRRPE